MFGQDGEDEQDKYSGIGAVLLTSLRYSQTRKYDRNREIREIREKKYGCKEILHTKGSLTTEKIQNTRKGCKGKYG